MQSAVYLPLYRHRWWIIYSIVYKSIHKHCSTCRNVHKLYKKQVSCMYALYEPSHVSHIWTHHLQSKLLHSMHVNDRVREGEGERWGRACNSASKNGGGRINYQLPFIAFCQKGRRKTTDPQCFEAHIHWMVYISQTMLTKTAACLSKRLTLSFKVCARVFVISTHIHQTSPACSCSGMIGAHVFISVIACAINTTTMVMAGTNAECPLHAWLYRVTMASSLQQLNKVPFYWFKMSWNNAIVNNNIIHLHTKHEWFRDEALS